ISIFWHNQPEGKEQMKDILNAESVRGTIVNSMSLSLLFIKWFKEKKTRANAILRDINSNRIIKDNHVGFKHDKRRLRSILLFVAILHFITIESSQNVLQQENLEQPSFAQKYGNIINL